jgi:ATP-dependent DNA ligase
MDWPLLKRQELLKRVIVESDRLVVVCNVAGSSCTALFEQVKQLGLEGLVFKRLDSRYVNRRSEHMVEATKL